MALRREQVPEFEVSTEDRGTTRTISLLGEIDIAAAPVVSSALAAALWHGDLETVVVDLTDASFIDSTGIQLLVDAYANSVQDGRRLVLLPGPPAVQRAFEISGLSERLPFVVDAHAARASADSTP